MRSITRRLSYANVVATLALFIALGGGAYAAIELPKDSVGRAQIRDRAVNSDKVLNASLLAQDFAPGQLPSGPQGKEGPAGPAGGLSGLEVVYEASATGPFSVKSSEAHCPAGKKVTGGGAVVGGVSNAAITTSAPGAVPNPTSWYAQAHEVVDSGGSWTLYAYAVCANVSE